MYRPILLALMAVLAQPFDSLGQQQTPPRQSQAGSDQRPPAAPSAEQFTRLASRSNLFDIEAARLATVRAANPDTSVFAQQVLNDQLKAQADLKVAAEEEGLPLENRLDGKQEQKLQDLKRREGESFDRAFYSTQKETQTSTLRLLSTYGSKGDRESLRAFAQSHYSTMRINFARAQSAARP